MLLAQRREDEMKLRQISSKMGVLRVTLRIPDKHRSNQPPLADSAKEVFHRRAGTLEDNIVDFDLAISVTSLRMECGGGRKSA